MTSSLPRRDGSDGEVWPSPQEIELLCSYVVDNAADHDDDCPCDDTCECSYRARNAAVNACCRFLLESAKAAPVRDVARLREEPTPKETAETSDDTNEDHCQQLKTLAECVLQDLRSAHHEILKLQGVQPEDFHKWDWPEWSGPANTMRFARRILERLK